MKITRHHRQKHKKENISQQRFILRVSFVILGVIATSLFMGQPFRSTQKAVADTVAVRDTSLNFPRMFLYGGINGSGWPLVGSWTTVTNTDGLPINQTAINAFAKFPLMTLSPTPLIDGRTDIMDALRAAQQRNYPSGKIFAYLVGQYIQCPADQQTGKNQYPDNYYYGRYWLAVAGTDVCASSSYRLLWLQDGHRADYSSDVFPNSLNADVNLAHHVDDGHGGQRYDVAEDVAQMIYDEVYNSHKFDGILIDVFCDDVSWAETATVKIDYQKAGYGSDNSLDANRTAFIAGWKAGHTAMATKLRALIDATGDTNFPISGNCNPGPTALHPYFNGWMREEFPTQDGSTWYTNMYRLPGGYFIEDYKFHAPQYNYIFSGTTGTDSQNSTSADNQKKMRFGLGTASLGNGWFTFEDKTNYPQNPDPSLYTPFAKWWYDEYSVNPITGEATGDASHVGWLGQPTGDVYQMISNNGNPELINTNGFESDSGLGFSLNHSGNSLASYCRVTNVASDCSAGGAAPVGTGYEHVTTTTLGDYDWNVMLASNSTFPVNAGSEYSVTFWARANQAQTINLAFDYSGSPSRIYQAQTISTEWKKYQVRLAPGFTGDGYQLWMQFTNLGWVDVDDVHVQLGVTSVYRRDFDNGLVLVNPSDTSQVVSLERTFYKISGTVNSALNNGDPITQVTLPGTEPQRSSPWNVTGDALFLVDRDTTPPAAVTDLRVQ